MYAEALCSHLRGSTIVATHKAVLAGDVSAPIETKEIRNSFSLFSFFLFFFFLLTFRVLPVWHRIRSRTHTSQTLPDARIGRGRSSRPQTTKTPDKSRDSWTQKRGPCEERILFIVAGLISVAGGAIATLAVKVAVIVTVAAA